MGKAYGFWERLSEEADLLSEPYPGQPIVEIAGDRQVYCRDQRRVCRQIGAAAAGGNHDRQGQRSVSDCTVGISTGNIQASLPGEL